MIARYGLRMMNSPKWNIVACDLVPDFEQRFYLGIKVRRARLENGDVLLKRLTLLGRHAIAMPRVVPIRANFVNDGVGRVLTPYETCGVTLGLSQFVHRIGRSEHASDDCDKGGDFIKR